MARTLSLTVPSGHLTLGNLLGAIRLWAEDQRGMTPCTASRICML